MIKEKRRNLIKEFSIIEEGLINDFLDKLEVNCVTEESSIFGGSIITATLGMTEIEFKVVKNGIMITAFNTGFNYHFLDEVNRNPSELKQTLETLNNTIHGNQEKRS